MRTYLCGSIDRADDGGVLWRQSITPVLNSMGVIVLDPLNKPFYGTSESSDFCQIINNAKKAGEYDYVQNCMRDVRTMDLRMVDVSDFIIANIDINVHMCGSYEEITTANRQKKPVLCWIKAGKAAAPNWLFGTIPHQHIFSSITDLLEYLVHIDDGTDMESYGRWYFPKFDMLYNEAVLNGDTQIKSYL